MFDKIKKITSSNQFKVIMSVLSAFALIYRFYNLYLEQQYYSVDNKSNSYDEDIVRERIFDYIGEHYPDTPDENILEIVNELFDTKKRHIK